MSERVLVTVHGGEPRLEAWPRIADLCAALLGPDADRYEPVVLHRQVGDPADGPVSFEFYVRGA